MFHSTKRGMLARISGLAAALCMLSGAAFADISGLFRTEPNDDGNYITVMFDACDDGSGLYCGVIAAAYNAEDEANEDYENIGRKIVWKMESKGSGVFEGGMIWAPDTDKTYNSQMKLSGDTLTVEGCILFICRGQDWTRVE